MPPLAQKCLDLPRRTLSTISGFGLGLTWVRCAHAVCRGVGLVWVRVHRLSAALWGWRGLGLGLLLVWRQFSSARAGSPLGSVFWVWCGFVVRMPSTVVWVWCGLGVRGVWVRSVFKASDFGPKLD